LVPNQTEPATFGGSYQSRTEVGQTAFGSVTLYVFQGGVLPRLSGSSWNFVGDPGLTVRR